MPYPDASPPLDPLMPVPGSYPAVQPLRGMTILAVEDSRFASEALRLYCQRSGARLRRAESLEAARQHLRCYRPDVVVIDLNMPDGPGTSLAREICERPRRPRLIGMSGEALAQHSFLAAGVDAYLAKPVESLRMFQSTVLRVLDSSLSRLTPVETDLPGPDPLAMRDDLRQALDMLAEPQDEGRARFVASFVEGIARLARDADLTRIASAARRSGTAGIPALTEILAFRLAAPVAPLIAPRPPN